MLRFFPLLILLLFLIAGLQDLAAAPTATPTGEPRVILDTSKAKDLVYAPVPKYPDEARKNHWGGFGIFEVQFRRDGKPWAVYVTMSTGHKVLDAATVRTLWQWRSWKGYKLIVQMVPITFSPGGELKGAAKSKQVYPR